MRLLPPTLLVALAVPALAQRPRVPVPVSNAEPMACSTARMVMLRRTRDLFAVRAGPSRRERVLFMLRERDPVYACVRQGNWFGIVFPDRRRPVDCGVQVRWRVARPYRGPCRSGWVHYDHIGEYADWISP